ncbi:MAG: PPK2 family polyphosphate kinase [Pseudomonadota bacterium]
MFEAPPSPYLVPFDGTFRLADASTTPTTDGHSHKKKHKRRAVRRLDELQRVLAASNQHSVLLVFQAMDAAGKDSTIRSVLQGVDPAGCQVFSFKRPSKLELDHDFLWRTTCRLPERGRIGVFNRSHYEEVLVVRVHPSILNFQQLPYPVDLNTVWDDRLHSIREHEAHVARNGTVILKFFLNVSREEQKRRFLYRLDTPEKNWKYEPNDVRERGYWDDYMNAYEAALNATSTSAAPWYAIPADDKPYMRARVAEIVINALQSLDMRYPEPSAEDWVEFNESRATLENE